MSNKVRNESRTVEDLGEFGFIKSIASGCINRLDGVVYGIGDDCAVIGPFGDRVLLVTTDLLIENVHFILDRIPPEHIGEKSIAVNLSDIAAMGGLPRHTFVSIAVPRLFPARVLNGIYGGIKSACKAYGVNLLGGDTSSSPGGLFINVTAIGETNKDSVMYRRGARVGDRIYVCGTLGGSVAGLKILKGEIPAAPEQWPSLVLMHTRPRALIKEGLTIGSCGMATAMIDISDGLVADLGHVCEESKVGAEVQEDSLPISEDLLSLGKQYHVDVTEYALTGGEDYALLVTVPPESAREFEKLLEQKTGAKPTDIGEITAGSDVKCMTPAGRQRHLETRGFNHFTS